MSYRGELREHDLRELRGELYRQAELRGERVPTAETILTAIHKIGWRKHYPIKARIKWSADATEILRNAYVDGADNAKGCLEHSGYTFSIRAIRARAHVLGLRVNKSKLFRRLVASGLIPLGKPPLRKRKKL